MVHRGEPERPPFRKTLRGLWLGVLAAAIFGCVVLTLQLTSSSRPNPPEPHPAISASLPPYTTSPAPPATPRPVQTRVATYYTVRAGDTLWGLAGVHWRRLYRLNRQVIGPDADVLRPGEKLRL